MRLLTKLLMRVGGGLVPIENPRIALVGDSLTQQNNATVSLNGVTLTRDADGIVTVPKATHQIYGTPKIYVNNCSDPSYEAMDTVTVINANSFSYPTGVIGAAGSIVGGSLTYAVVQNRFSLSSYWAWLQSKFNGGLGFLGNYGQGGDRADEMTAAMTAACATDAEFIVLCAGINDINSGAATGATVITRVQALVDIATGAGKKVVLISVTPLGSAFASSGKNTATLAANAGFASMAAANPTSVFYADAHQDLVDTGATQFTTGQAWSWATIDGVHWGMRAAELIAARVQSAITAAITAESLLPTESGQLPNVAGWTAVKQYGAWTDAGGGFNGTGSSGTVQPQLQVISGNAATTVVNSLIDRGAGLGYWQQHVITPGGTNHQVTDYFQTNAGETLASLGLTTSDTVMLAVEFEASGLIASGSLGLQLDCNSNSTGAFGYGRCGSYAGASTWNADAPSGLLVTGEFKLNASVTHIQSQLGMRVAAADVDTFTVKIGRVILYKKNP